MKIINGHEENLPAYTGEFYITVAYENESKGGHYHKKANEWFTLIKGKCNLRLFDISTSESTILNLDAGSPKTVFVPPGIAHIFINTGKEDFILSAYSDQLYDPEDTCPFSFE